MVMSSTVVTTAFSLGGLAGTEQRTEAPSAVEVDSLVQKAGTRSLVLSHDHRLPRRK
jgi:hypothetical protein